MGASRYFELTESIRLDLLELYGSGYVIEHCVSAQKRYTEEKRLREFERDYVADCLRIITENTAKLSGGSYYSRKLSEALAPKKEEEPIDGDALALEVIRKAGLKARKGVE